MRYRRPLAASVVIVVALQTGSCSEDATEPSGSGSIWVGLTMTGTNLDPDGCKVSLDGGAEHSILAGGSVTFSDVEAGDHLLSLTDLAVGCTVNGENPQTVTVVANQTIDVVFDVTCANQPEVTFDKIAVAVVHGGGEEAVTVKATDADGQEDGWTVVSSDPAKVEASRVGRGILVTGHDPGEATVTVTSDSDVSRSFEVVVYDPMVLAVNDGDLLIKYTDQFDPTYFVPGECHAGLSDIGCASSFHPVTEDGWYALGSLGVGPAQSYDAIIGSPMWMIVVKDAAGGDNPTLMPPDGFTLEYDFHAGDAPWVGAFWRPECPAGYVAMGSVVTSGEYPPVPPSTEAVRCVRADLTKVGRAVQDYDAFLDVGGLSDGNKMALIDDKYVSHPQVVSHDHGVGSFRAWRVTAPTWDDPLDSNAYLETGTFVAIGDATDCGDGVPNDSDQYDDALLISPIENSCWDPEVLVATGRARVLAVKLPVLIDAGEKWLPRLTSWTAPPTFTEPTLVKAMRVPFTLLLTDAYGQKSAIAEDLSSFLLYSPFVVIERTTQFRLFEEWVDANTGAASTVRNIRWTVGTEETETETFSHTAGVSLSVTVGFTFLGLKSSVTAEVSYEFGYETQESFTVFQSTTTGFERTCPAYHTCVTWTDYTRLIVKKLTEQGWLREVANIDYRGGFYYTDTYPR